MTPLPLILVVYTQHGRMLEDVERQLIADTLHEHNGHRKKTAAALGMGVRTLGMKLSSYRQQQRATEAAR